MSAHVGNVLLHALNAVLVFLLLQAVIAAWHGSENATKRTVPLAAFSALIWALHPMRVEVVGWASGRMYCQAGVFLLLAGLAYFRAAACASRRSAHAFWIAMATLAFGASLLTYPIGLMFVAVLVIIDVFVLRRFPPGVSWLDRRVRGVWLEKIPFVAMAAAVAAATLAARFQAQGIWEPPPTLVAAELDRQTGMPADSLTPSERRYTEYFLPGTEPGTRRVDGWKIFRWGPIVF